MTWMNLVSDLGDSAVLLPLSLLLTAALWRYQSWAAAASFLWATVFCTGVMLLLKLSFLACGSVWQAGILSPSGHASMSTAVYGTLAIVSARQATRWQQPMIVLLSVLVIAGVAVSRVVLGMHSPAEVLLGLIVGASALGIFAFQYYRLNPAELNLPLFLSLSVAVLLVLHGAHLPAEQIIRHLASILRSTTRVCPGG
jgi:membrane-associated phospholipid phosphatase